MPTQPLVAATEHAGRHMLPLVSTGDVVILWGGGVARNAAPPGPA